MPRKCPSARVVARLMTMARDQLSRQDAVLVAAFEAAVPALVSVRNLVDRFHQMIQRKQVSELASCIEQAEGTALASFANGLNADQAAVVAALSEPRSNGQTEGQITKLKLVKRQMYGRAKLDLLRVRLVPSAWSELHQI
jgi:transposase